MKKPIEFRNAGGSGPAEILIYDLIGRDWWSDDGITAKDFAESLKTIPASQEITVRINSEGGNVHDGLSIYNQLNRRKSTVTCVIDGVAASTAGWIAMAGKKVVMPKNALLMMHNPEACYQGDAEELRSMAAALDTHKASIVSIYTDKTGKTAEEISALMDAETWMTGAEALAAGFCDELTEDVAITNSADKFSRFRNVPTAIRGNTTQTTGQTMSKPNTPTGEPQTAGGGNQPPITNQNGATGTQGAIGAIGIPGASAPTDAVTNRLEAMEAKFKNQRRAFVTNAVDAAISQHRIPAAQRDRWIERGIADETDGVVNDLAALPQLLPGASPVAVEITNENGMNLGAEFQRLSGAARSAFYNQHGARIRAAVVSNANTIPSALKRDVIAQTTMRAFARQIAPLAAFSAVFRDTPLQGTAKVQVPYVALNTASSTDWNASNGYVMADGTQSNKEITVDKRKYQPVRWTSDEFARQPYLKVEELSIVAADKLAYDVFVDVLSLVTAANYSTAALVSTAANFDSADIATIRRVCKTANWPEMGRALFIDPTFEEYLLRDSAVKTASSFGSDSAIKEGVVARVHGFDIYCPNGIPGNSENLAGFAASPGGILVVLSPIQPTAEVRAQLTRYEIMTDARTGISLEHRTWGNADYDQSRSVIEVNYGYAVGEAAAIKRITTS